MDKGVAFLTEDRRGEGLMMEASITDNIVLPSLVERSSGFAYWLKPAALGERRAAWRSASELTPRRSTGPPCGPSRAATNKRS